MELGAVIVAAGMSSRMGNFKPMLDIGEISIAKRVIATLTQAGASRIVVVTGHRADELEHHLSKTGVVFLRNEAFASTEMFDSALIGMKYLKDKCERLLFTPVDVPLFTAETVEALLKSEGKIACPVFEGEPGHPILLESEVIEKLIGDSGKGGLKGAISRTEVPVSMVEVNDQGILHDADTPADYSELLELHNKRLARPVVQVSLQREKPFLDSRIAMLLELVSETGSVSSACKRMQMSYSAGWNVINGMERQAGHPLIYRCHGGANGGGSGLTVEGRELIRKFRKLEAEVREAAEKSYNSIFS